MGLLDGKVALVTGGARGMGEAHVRLFLREGARVVFGDVLDEEGKALAQETGSVKEPGQSPLNLPKDITFFGKPDPNLHKATAIVDGTIITDTDIDQRLALVLAANGGKIEGEERDRLRLQVLHNLIDEALQIQEAKGNEINITPAEID